MRISLCGAQGTGKSTLFEIMKTMDIFHDYVFINGPGRKIKQMGYNINREGNEDTQLLALYFNIESAFYENAIMERGIIDTLVYSKHQLKNNKIGEKIDNVTKDLSEFIINKYDLIIKTSLEFELVDDGTRDTCDKYQENIDNLYDEILLPHSDKLLVVKGTIEERITQIINKIKEIQKVI